MVEAFRFAWELIARRKSLFAAPLAAVWALLSAYDFHQGQICREPCEYPPLSAVPYLSAVPVWVWLFAAAAVLAVVISENARNLVGEKDAEIKALKERLEPRFRLSFDPSDGCVSETTFTATGTKVKFFRLNVEALTSDPIPACSGSVFSVRKNGEPTQFSTALQLTWAPADDREKPLQITLVEGTKNHLDVCFITEANVVGFGTLARRMPNGLLRLFDEVADYEIGVVVTSAQGPPQRIHLLLRRRQGMDSTEMTNVAG